MQEKVKREKLIFVLIMTLCLDFSYHSLQTFGTITLGPQFFGAEIFGPKTLGSEIFGPDLL